MIQKDQSQKLFFGHHWKNRNTSHLSLSLYLSHTHKHTHTHSYSSLFSLSFKFEKNKMKWKFEEAKSDAAVLWTLNNKKRHQIEILIKKKVIIFCCHDQTIKEVVRSIENWEAEHAVVVSIKTSCPNNQTCFLP